MLFVAGWVLLVISIANERWLYGFACLVLLYTLEKVFHIGTPKVRTMSKAEKKILTLLNV